MHTGKVLALGLLLIGCEGSVFEPGDYPVEGVVADPKAPKVVAFSCDATAVSATVPVQCLIQASNPTGGAVACTLDPGDGQPPIALGDCSQAQSTTVKFANPGQTTMRLLVQDAQGRSSERTVVIDVTGLPNQPPTLSELRAQPQTGGAPLTTTISFTAVDPDADPLTCSIDVGADGTVDFPSVDCARGTQQLVVQREGDTPVRVAVRDDRGGAAEATISLTVLRPVGDLRISQVDWGQTVMLREPRLVEGKRALLRVSVLATAPNLPGVVVEAEGRRGATALGKLTLEGPPAPPTSETLADLTKQYRILVPAEWIAPGLEVTVTLDARGAVPETDEANNVQVLTPQVGRGNVLHLTSVPVVQSGLTGRVQDSKATMTAVWPLKDVEARTRAPYTSGTQLSALSGSAWGALLGELAQVRAADGSQRHYYGWLRVNFGSGIAGIGYIGQPTAIGRDDSLSTHAHELGHNFGRPHAPCGGAAGPDPAYPYASARIGVQGFDGTRLLAPQSYVDLMSYCSPEWVSDYNYRLVQRDLESDATFSGTATLPYVAAAMISGVVRGDAVALDPLVRLHGALTPPQEGELTLRLWTRDGRERRVPVALRSPADGDEQHFLAIVEDPGALLAVEVLRGAKVLAREVASPAAGPVDPEVFRVDAQTLRVKWNAAAWPALSVAHLSGDERTTLALRLAGGDVLVRVDGLRGGRVELSASSGLASERVLLPLPE